MTTLASPPRGGAGTTEALHDRLEGAYFSLARSSPRWFEQRSPMALFGGFAGLDSPTMNRIALLAAPDERALDGVLAEAERFFGARRLPWSVQVTPFTKPKDADALLRARGFNGSSALTVMTHSQLAEPPVLKGQARDVLVREATLDEVGKFTAVMIDAFRMPTKFLPALTDVNRSWIEAGGRSYFAVVGSSVAGTALLTRHSGIAGVYNVAALPHFRRRGVATALMRRLIEDYRTGSERILTLQAARGSVAERFYERIGFLPRYGWTLYTRDG